MVEFIIGFFMGITVMCIMSISKEVDNEEKKTSDKEKNAKKNKRT